MVLTLGAGGRAGSPDSDIGIEQARLAGHAKLDVMMTSQVLRALEARGLLERRAHPSDTRAKALRLTGAGRALAARAVPVVEGADTSFFAGLGAARAGLNKHLLALIESRTENTSRK